MIHRCSPRAYNTAAKLKNDRVQLALALCINRRTHLIITYRDNMPRTNDRLVCVWSVVNRVLSYMVYTSCYAANIRSMCHTPYKCTNVRRLTTRLNLAPRHTWQPRVIELNHILCNKDLAMDYIFSRTHLRHSIYKLEPLDRVTCWWWISALYVFDCHDGFCSMRSNHSELLCIENY